jgi:OTU-like cysteine protease
MRDISSKLRQLSVRVLQTAKDECFILEGEESMAASQLLEMAARNYNMTSNEYLSQMVQPSTWGGGPEIVALANHFKRPIHVYELESHGMLWMKRFQLRICAKFGSPAFDNKHPLNILCADGRFPNIRPGKHREPGDHFLTLFRTDEVPFHRDSIRKMAKKRTLRSGAGAIVGGSSINTGSSSGEKRHIVNHRLGRWMRPDSDHRHRSADTATTTATAADSLSLFDNDDEFEDVSDLDEL